MEQETKRCPFCGEEILAVAKKCKHCGEWLNKDEERNEEKVMIPCPVCGEMVEEGISQCPYCHESLDEDGQEHIEETITDSEGDNDSRSFFDYYFVEPFIKQYFKFKGRINRKHFWISILLWIIFSALVVLLMDIGHNGPAFPVVIVLFSGWLFLSIIPIWAAVLRRMRDGDSELGFWGWGFYFTLSPIVLWWLVKPSDDTLRDDGVAPDEEQEVSFKKSDKIAICIIILFVLGITLVSNTSGADNSTNNAQTEERAPIEEKTTESNATQDIKTAYLSLLAKYSEMTEEEGYGNSSTYFLFDITGDGVPEVWIKSGSCEADYKLSVYTYDNGISVIEEGEDGDAGNSAFYEGDNYILHVYGHMGFAGWVKITYSGGKLKHDLVFEEDINESGNDGYTEPSEKPIEEYFVSDTAPIKMMFGN